MLRAKLDEKEKLVDDLSARLSAVLEKLATSTVAPLRLGHKTVTLGSGESESQGLAVARINQLTQQHFPKTEKQKEPDAFEGSIACAGNAEKDLAASGRKRLRDNPAVPDVAARAAYYNTTGVLVDVASIRYRWRIGGKIRFNGIGGFHSDQPGSLPETAYSSARIPKLSVVAGLKCWFRKKLILSGTTGSLSFRGTRRARAHGTSRRRIGPGNRIQFQV